MQLLRHKQDLLELDDVGVVEFPQRLDLSQFKALIPVLILTFHLLDGHNLIGFFVDGLEDSSEGAIT